MHSPDALDVELTVDAETPLPDDITEPALAGLVRHVLVEEGVSGRWLVGIRFVNDPTMQRAHQEFMGIDTPTDIMTFPYEDEGFDLPDSDPRSGDSQAGGDLLISSERAAEHAADAGWSHADELRFLVCHGMLHLLGWDDATDKERAAMLDRQAALIASWKQGGVD